MTTENNYRFPTGPTMEQIDKVVKASGGSEQQFERFNGMYRGCIAHARMGFRKLPSKFWHLFLDPANKSVAKSANNATNKNPRKTRKVVKKDSLISSLVSK